MNKFYGHKNDDRLSSMPKKPSQKKRQRSVWKPVQVHIVRRSFVQVARFTSILDSSKWIWEFSRLLTSITAKTIALDMPLAC